jgi:hypothetical protein
MIGVTMPMVGGKKYPYTKAGKAAAKKAAKKVAKTTKRSRARRNNMDY